MMTVDIIGCVNCGYCCRQCACSYGTWDPREQRCVQLTKDNLCALYAEIVELEKDSRYPMFSGHCTSRLFNTARESKIKELKNGKANER